MRTLRFHLPVLDADDAGDFLDVVTRVDGVVAALVDEEAAWLDVVVSSEAIGLLVQEEVKGVLLAGWRESAASAA